MLPLASSMHKPCPIFLSLNEIPIFVPPVVSVIFVFPLEFEALTDPLVVSGAL